MTRLDWYLAPLLGALLFVSCSPCDNINECGCEDDDDPDDPIDDGGNPDDPDDPPPLSCDPPCAEGEACVDRMCQPCGFAACGGWCCEDGEVCGAGGGCCRPDCSGRECGDDGCGGSCGECLGGDDCSPTGHCCVPDCDGRVCGGDGCGGSCGECDLSEFCIDDGRACGPSAGGYEHSSRDNHFLEPVLNLDGHYGLTLGGGHLLASDASGGSGFPRDTPVASTDTIHIPEGATVRYAFLWVGGTIFLKPHDAGEGDYTADLGGPLDSIEDMQSNGSTFALNGEQFGPFDTSVRLPPGQTHVGSESQLSPLVFDPHYGTLQGTKVTGWANRLDVTSFFSGRTGDVNVEVQPPERLDINGNDAMHNGGNNAGNTLYNACSGGASWSVVVIYESPDQPRQNVILNDGNWLRAWDYMFFHTGRWQRPAIQIDHLPIQPGARFYLYGTAGGLAGAALPNSPTCTCGCAGTYTLTHSGFMTNDYFSRTYLDPAECADDPMHRDRTNGPWYLQPGAMSQPVVGNDWTLFQSGTQFTEFPNLFEGHEMPGADGVQPVTNENDANAGHDTYRGHPWDGRGLVTYHAAGNSVSVVEVELDPSVLEVGSTTSYLYFRGDQKDVWKPQHAMLIKYIIFVTPIEE
jgi:hypothetical protein